MNSMNKCFFNRLMPALLLLTGAALSVSAQMTKPKPTPGCPQIYVSSPERVATTAPITFSVNVSGGDVNATPTYNWTISAGTIESGQGTSSIIVPTTDLGGQTVTASVDVGGYARQCSTFKSTTTLVTGAAEAKKFDEYRKINLEDEQARLDNFAVALQNDPTAIGYIISYGGRQSQPDEAQKMADAAGNYLIETRGIKLGRALVGIGGYREEPTTELWLAPAGATPPNATPTLDPSEVKPAKGTKKPSKAQPKPKAKPKTGKKN